MNSLIDFLHTTHQGNLTKKGNTPSERENSQSNEGSHSLTIPLAFLSKIDKGEKDKVVTMNNTENDANTSGSNSLIIPLTFIPSAMTTSVSNVSKDGMDEESHVDDPVTNVPSDEKDYVGTGNGSADTLSMTIPFQFISKVSELQETVNNDQVYKEEQVTELPQSTVEESSVSSLQVSVTTPTRTLSKVEPSDKIPTDSHSSIAIPLTFLSSSSKDNGREK